jgi:hypothetical protein
MKSLILVRSVPAQLARGGESGFEDTNDDRSKQQVDGETGKEYEGLDSWLG